MEKIYQFWWKQASLSFIRWNISQLTCTSRATGPGAWYDCQRQELQRQCLLREQMCDILDIHSTKRKDVHSTKLKLGGQPGIQKLCEISRFYGLPKKKTTLVKLSKHERLWKMPRTAGKILEGIFSYASSSTLHPRQWVTQSVGRSLFLKRPPKMISFSI